MFLMRTREPAIKLVKQATQRIGRGVMYATQAIKKKVKKITFTS
jgi:hypothetical protein